MLLLGLIREEEGIAARVLNNLGVDRFKVRNDVVRLISDASTVLNPEMSLSVTKIFPKPHNEK